VYQKEIAMQITNNLYAFLWQSMTVNNCNTYLIDGPTRILIDPGHVKLFDHVRSGLGELGLTLKDIGLVICTHAHPDHLEAVQLFKDTPALFAIHATEWQWIKSMEKQIQATFGMTLDFFMPDFFLKEGDLTVGDLKFQVFHTPGHSPGSVCIYWPETRALFTGDLIFSEGLGRTDLPGGNGEQLKASIRRVSELDTEWLLSGHGNIVSGTSRVKNNFDQVEQFWFAYV